MQCFEAGGHSKGAGERGREAPAAWIIMNPADKIVLESQINEIKSLIETRTDLYPQMRRSGILLNFKNLNEAISSEDWGRIGVLAGLLWYKLDLLVKCVDGASSTLRNIERNTSRGK